MTNVTEQAADIADPAHYHHWTSVTLRYADQDPMGHVNNAAYLVYFEASRVLYTSELLGHNAPIDTVLARVTVNFLRETSFPGTLEIGAALTRVGNKSFESVYGAFRDGTCLATAECVNVFFDTRARRSVAPPDDVRAAMTATLERRLG